MQVQNLKTPMTLAAALLSLQGIALGVPSLSRINSLRAAHPEIQRFVGTVDSQGAAPTRKAKVRAQILRSWYERVGDRFEEREEVVCNKQTEFNVYEQADQSGGDFGDFARISCPTTITTAAGRRNATAIIGGLVSQGFHEVFKGSEKEYTIAAMTMLNILQVDESGAQENTPDSQPSLVSITFADSVGQPTKLGSVLMPSNPKVCVKVSEEKEECVQKYPESFEARILIEDAGQ